MSMTLEELDILVIYGGGEKSMERELETRTYSDDLPSCQVCGDATADWCDTCGGPACDRHMIDNKCEKCLKAEGANVGECEWCGDTVNKDVELPCQVCGGAMGESCEDCLDNLPSEKANGKNVPACLTCCGQDRRRMELEARKVVAA